METNERERKAALFVRGMAAHLLDEVIKADMSMHHAQIEVWKDFGISRPYGNLINPDIHIGFAEERYLCLKEVKFTLYIRQISASIYSRIRDYLIGRFGITNLPRGTPVIFDICTPGAKNAIAMHLTVKRFENGTISADYGPADDKTRELMNEVEIGNK
jgi:hypothetical protein